MKEIGGVVLLTPVFMEMWPMLEMSLWAGMLLGEGLNALELPNSASLGDLVQSLTNNVV